MRKRFFNSETLFSVGWVSMADMDTLVAEMMVKMKFFGVDSEKN